MLKKGDEVEWQTPQGPTSGTVTRKVTSTAKVGSHVAEATPDKPQFEVRSRKSGRSAIHKEKALKKVDGKG